MKFEFARYKDHFQLILYLLLGAMTPLFASFLIMHLKPVA